MHEDAKYLIHAEFTADGVVERNDVVGAIYGQTEGLLGSKLDLRNLQDTSKVGRIEVDVSSEGGQSYGEITIASGLDRVETAILAASLETIDRVGPCRATIEVTGLEDVRTAKRERVVDRATELLAEFEADAVTSGDIVEEVRERVRVEDMTEHEGLPAGPKVPDSDALVVVEGRADVVQLLAYGVKNAIAVEGTDVPAAVADLTRDRTTTAFLDGDRGGELILRELAQVGDVDYVAFAPPDTCVEDLSREQALSALREKVPYEAAAGEDFGSERVGPDDGEADAAQNEGAATAEDGSTTAQAAATGEVTDTDGGTATEPVAADEDLASAADEDRAPVTVAGHARALLAADLEEVRLLDGDADVIADGPADGAFDLLEATDPAPRTVVLNGTLTQRLLDLAAQRGVEQVVAAAEGEFVKRPTNVQIRALDDF